MAAAADERLYDIWFRAMTSCPSLCATCESGVFQAVTAPINSAKAHGNELSGACAQCVNVDGLWCAFFERQLGAALCIRIPRNIYEYNDGWCPSSMTVLPL